MRVWNKLLGCVLFLSVLLITAPLYLALPAVIALGCRGTVLVVVLNE